MAARRPNLFIVGAMKAGTSSLHSYLHLHPGIFMCEPKEPCFFVSREQLDWPAIEKFEFWHEPNYLELFEKAGDARFVGESSTLYTKAPRISGVPERIARYSPGARIVYMTRDPIERTISHYWHTVRWENERRDLLTALREEPHYREVSYYAMQIRPYLDLFGRDRVISFTLEELSGDANSVLSELCTWLDLPAAGLPADLGRPRNVTPPEVDQVRGRGRLERFRWSPFWDRVGSWIPKPVRLLGRQLATRRVDRQLVDRERAVAWLRPRQLDETAELVELLGRDYPDWRTLRGG